MVKGLDTFRNHFAGYEEQYVLIGGAACDIVFDTETRPRMVKSRSFTDLINLKMTHIRK